MRYLDLNLINCEIEIDLTWSRKCITSRLLKTPEAIGNPGTNPPVPTRGVILTSRATFQINSSKCFVCKRKHQFFRALETRTEKNNFWEEI